MKHEKDERSALFEYLDDNDCTIYSYGEAQNEVHELETILEGLQKYDSPDMYAIVGNMLVIIEHFAFDASRETKRKGMERIRKDREAHAKMWADVMNGNIPAVIVTQARETLSLHTWQMNFEKHFGSHYAKIGQYIENAKKAANMEQSIETEEIVRCKTGFFIEEEFPPILDVNGTLREVRYIETKQFLDFFRDKIKVDFISVVQIQNGRKIELLAKQAELCHISNPLLVRPFRMEVSVQQIGRNLAHFSSVKTIFFDSDTANQSQLLHEPLYCLVIQVYSVIV